MQLQVWLERAMYNHNEEDYGIWPASWPQISGGPDCEPVGPRWFAQYTAPGYLDATDLVWAETPWEAARSAFELFGDDERGSDDAKELARILWQCTRNRRGQKASK